MDMDKNQQGIEFMQQGKYEEAAKVFNEAIEENPNEPVAYINFGNVLLLLVKRIKPSSFIKRRSSWMKMQQRLIIH